MAISESSNNAAISAVKGKNSAPKDPANAGAGIEGDSDNGWGVYGHSTNGRGVVARSVNDYGLRAHSTNLSGIRASSDNGVALEAASKTKTGIFGSSETGIGVEGKSDTSVGVQGESDQHTGVSGRSNSFVGVLGESTQFEGVRGISHHPGHGAVVGTHASGGIAVYGKSENNGVGIFGEGGRLAGYFKGDVEVTGDIRFVNASDIAEDFEIAEAVEPGTVMVLGDEGVLQQSCKAYDKRVAGVISGAGSYKPGIILDKQESQTNRLPIGLMGKVYCKVEALSSPIEIGDLLTTSPVSGHAMKATNAGRAFGAVIGKALRPLQVGKGLIPVLVSLQ